MSQIHYRHPNGPSAEWSTGDTRKPSQAVVGLVSRAVASPIGARPSPVDELALFQSDCSVALRSLRGGRLRLDWISVPMPARAFHDPMTLARLKRLAAEEDAGFAKLRFEVDLRYLAAELEHVVRVQASLTSARLALAVRLEAGLLPLTSELSRSGVKLLVAPPALSASASVDLAARAELRYIALLARAIEGRSAVHAVSNRAALAQCLAAGIDHIAAPCCPRGAAAVRRPLIAGKSLN